MGYYVEIKDSDFLIPNEHLDAAFEALKEINKDDSLKRGGNGRGGHWFAWMDEDYDKTARDTQHIFEMLRIDFTMTQDGLWIYDYESKLGDERHFLHAVAPYVTDGAVILWVGEDTEYFIDVFHDSQHVREDISPARVESIYSYLFQRRGGENPPITDITQAFS
jgi:hypothetical protein